MEVLFQTSSPSNEEYYALLKTTGWNEEYPVSSDDLAHVIANSRFFVVAYAGEQLVGFGRVLTDGVLYTMIYAMIVHPDYQPHGFGTQILQRLIQWCEEKHIHDTQLVWARSKHAFYEKNGFDARPDDSPCMQYCHKL